MGNTRIRINNETRYTIVVADPPPPNPFSGQYEDPLLPVEIPIGHHRIVQVNATKSLNQTDGAFDYNIVNLRGAVLGVLHVTYFCGVNNLNNLENPNHATLVIEQLAVTPIFAVATNPDAAVQRQDPELNVHFKITVVPPVAPAAP